MGPYIVDIFSFSPLALLNIMDGTCVGKCPTPIGSFLSKWVVTNKPLVPIFGEGLNMLPQIIPSSFIKFK